MFRTAVFGLGYPVGAECVSLYDIRACCNVFIMNRPDYFRSGNVKALVISFEFFSATPQNPIPVVLLAKRVPLYHRTHGSVQDQNPFSYIFFK